MTPSVYISVEESARELASKLLLASILAERGYNVVIGQQWLLNANLSHLPAGIVLFKGNNAIQHSNMQVAKRAGHLVASIEEEALMVIDEGELRRLFDTGVHSTCDLFLAHGQAMADLLTKWFPWAATKVVVTGNPRIDLLRPDFLRETYAESEKIRGEIGRFVLCNLNYATINSGLGDTLAYFDTCVAAKIYRDNDDKDERLFRELVQWEYDNLQAMTAAIAHLDKALPNITIVVRPHPSEQFDVWQRALSDRPRVKLIKGGNHLPWTVASEIMLHTSCTTGAEAFLAGNEAVSLCPSTNALTSSFLSNLVNATFATPAEACRYIQLRADGAKRSSSDDERYSRALDHHIAARTGPLAAERIADAIAQRLPKPSAAPWSVGGGFRANLARSTSQMHKISGTADDIRAGLSKLLVARKGASNLSVREIGNALFAIEAQP